MTTQRQSLIKPTVLNEVLKLPAKEMQSVIEKVALLQMDPLPDGKTKKQLIHLPGKLYRIRAGRYRIIYTFNQKTVSIYKIAIRNQALYAHGVPTDDDDADDATDLDIKFDDVDVSSLTWSTWSDEGQSDDPGPPAGQVLPKPITVELLKELYVAEKYHPRLLRVLDEDGLLNCDGVDPTTLTRIIEHIYPPSLSTVMQQHDLVLNDANDLKRYKEGDLLDFLLLLDKVRTFMMFSNIDGQPSDIGSKNIYTIYRHPLQLCQNT
jgi:mRNA-degrading endonuclease RelE of RelBE toxin-antitoxin system